MRKLLNDEAKCFQRKHLKRLHMVGPEYTCTKPDKDVRGDHQGYQTEWMISDCKNFERK